MSITSTEPEAWGKKNTVNGFWVSPKCIIHSLCALLFAVREQKTLELDWDDKKIMEKLNMHSREHTEMFHVERYLNHSCMWLECMEIIRLLHYIVKYDIRESKGTIIYVTTLWLHEHFWFSWDNMNNNLLYLTGTHLCNSPSKKPHTFISLTM